MSPSVATPPAGEGHAARARLEDEIARLRDREQEAAHRLLKEQQAALMMERAVLERERLEFERAKDAAVPPTVAGPRVPGAEPVAEISASEPSTGPRSPRAPSASDDRDYQMFYEGLSPYGRWLESDAYGWVWQPGAARERAWRPYTRGRWVDSDQGWAWVSDEPFGWATYHYGRWALLVGHGWTWIPGDTWAPAWVAWRRNDDCVGWAPLPPETLYAADVTYGPEVEADCGLTADWYTFMPVRHFDEPVARYCRPLVENSRFFGLTAGVTQIVVRRDHVVCGGPEPRWINGCLARPMPRHSIHHRHEWRDQRDYRPRFADTRLSCYSPRVRADWNDAIRPHRTHGRLDNVRVVRREESFRRELARRYNGERDQRRARALAAMKAEPARRPAKRHEELERIRAGHAVAESRQNDRSERGESVAGRPRGQEPPTAAPGASKAGPPKGPRDRQEIAARIEDKRRAHDDKERSVPPRRPEARPQAQRQEQARGEAAERQQAAQAKQRAEQARNAQEHHKAKRRTQDQEAADRRREVAERQKAAEIKVRAERTRRAEAEQRAQQQEESRREAAQRRRAAEERSKTDESRRARGRGASERRPKEEAHPRVQRANEERERNKN